jgi:hypothetical protein
MKFTKKLHKEITEKFDEIAPEAACSLCGESDLEVIDGFVILPVHNYYPIMLRSLSSGDAEIPCVTMVCNTCSNTFLLNLLTLGVDLD